MVGISEVLRKISNPFDRREDQKNNGGNFQFHAAIVIQHKYAFREH